MKKFGITVLRVLIGALFVGHGLQKLRGWFGGGGLEGTAAGFQKMGMEPAHRQAMLAGLTETTAGALLATGFLTPVASSMVSGVMTVAIRHVHAKNGIWVTKGGYEYNAVLMASVFAITAEGPGSFALDNRLGLARPSTRLAFAQLGAGLAGATGVEVLARRAQAAAPTSSGDAGPGESVSAPPPHSSLAASIDLRGDVAPAEDGPVIPNTTLVEHPTP